jgi:uncharacterized membrane protein (DUF4010 family)
MGRIAQKDPEQSADALRASMLAGSLMYPRVLILVYIINQDVGMALWWKALLLMVVGIGMSLTVSKSGTAINKDQMPVPQNPFEIRPSLVFAVLFVILSVLTIIVRESLGDPGLVGLSVITGVSDIDPFILSLAHNPGEGIKLVTLAIVVAMMSNTMAKGIYFAILSKERRKESLTKYAIWALVHVPLLFIA